MVKYNIDIMQMSCWWWIYLIEVLGWQRHFTISFLLGRAKVEAHGDSPMYRLNQIFCLPSYISEQQKLHFWKGPFSERAKNVINKLIDFHSLSIIAYLVSRGTFSYLVKIYFTILNIYFSLSIFYQWLFYGILEFSLCMSDQLYLAIVPIVPGVIKFCL